MFEDSLVESRGFEVSSSKRWTSLASISLQVAIAAVVIAMPLFHPEALPFHEDAPRVLVPLMPKPPVVVERVSSASSSSVSPAAPSVTQPLIFSSSGGTAVSQAPVLAAFGSRMADGLPEGLGAGSGPRVSVVPVEARLRRFMFRRGCCRGC